MTYKIKVSNLSLTTSDEALEEICRPHGDVLSARVQTNRDTGRSLGYGIVEIETQDLAVTINTLNLIEFGGKKLSVSQVVDERRRTTNTPITRWER